MVIDLSLFGIIERGRERQKEKERERVMSCRTFSVFPEGMIFYQRLKFAYFKHTNGYGVLINYSYLILNRLSFLSFFWPIHNTHKTPRENSIIHLQLEYLVILMHT